MKKVVILGKDPAGLTGVGTGCIIFTSPFS